jgi:hypothetical protein
VHVVVGGAELVAVLLARIAAATATAAAALAIAEAVAAMAVAALAVAVVALALRVVLRIALALLAWPCWLACDWPAGSGAGRRRRSSCGAPRDDASLPRFATLRRAVARRLGLALGLRRGRARRPALGRGGAAGFRRAPRRRGP